MLNYVVLPCSLEKSLLYYTFNTVNNFSEARLIAQLTLLLRNTYHASVISIVTFPKRILKLSTFLENSI